MIRVEYKPPGRHAPAPATVIATDGFYLFLLFDGASQPLPFPFHPTAGLRLISPEAPAPAPPHPG